MTGSLREVEQAMSGSAIDAIDVALKTLAEPRRRAILRLVTVEELPAGEIARHFSVSRPAVSQHLAVLRSAGLVSERRVGTRRLYRADTRGLEPVRLMLTDMWAAALESAASMAESGVANDDRSRSTA